jgi:hypothetical protein
MVRDLATSWSRVCSRSSILLLADLLSSLTADCCPDNTYSILRSRVSRSSMVSLAVSFRGDSMLSHDHQLFVIVGLVIRSFAIEEYKKTVMGVKCTALKVDKAEPSRVESG